MTIDLRIKPVFLVIKIHHFSPRFANGDKLLPNDCLNILCVMKFRGSEVNITFCHTTYTTHFY